MGQPLPAMGTRAQTYEDKVAALCQSADEKSMMLQLKAKNYNNFEGNLKIVRENPIASSVEELE